MRRIRMTLWVLCACATLGRANTVFITSALGSDDGQFVYGFTLTQQWQVTMRTEGYAGSPELGRPGGGFDPVLSLFDSTAGMLLAVNGDGGCAKVLADATTAKCWDSYWTGVLSAGAYQIVMTEEDNYPNGPTLADGFARDRQGNFSAGLVGAASGAFWDTSGAQRNGNLILVLDLPDASTAPEPSSALLGLTGLLLAGGARLRKRRRARD